VRRSMIETAISVSDCGMFYTQNILVRIGTQCNLVLIAAFFSPILSLIFIKSTYFSQILQHLKMLRGNSRIMGRFPNLGKCVISYKEMLLSVLKSVTY